MTNLNPADIKLEQYRSEADAYRQLQPIRAHDLRALVNALQSILEIAKNWSLGQTEKPRALKQKTI